jgi:hypothetical protein
MKGLRPGLVAGSAFLAIALGLFIHLPTLAQDSKPQAQIIDQIRAAVQRDRKNLARYTWKQTETVSKNGTVIKRGVYSVRLNASGDPVRTVVSQSPSPEFAQYQQYGKQLSALAQRYAHLDANRLRELQAKGNVDIRSVGPPGVAQLDIDNYAKSGDSITLNFNKSKKQLLGYIVFTYLSNPSDDIGFATTFATLPDGTVYSTGVMGHSDSRNLDINLSNSDFQRS